MKKFVPIIIVVILLAAAVGVLAKSRHKSTTSSSTPTSSSTTNTTTSNSTSTTTPSVSTNSVSIKDFAFSPISITVKKGTTVTWTNQDGTAHTVTSYNSGGPDSGTLSNGKSYSFTFNTAGTFTYHCNFHSDMKGTVTVTD